MWCKQEEGNRIIGKPQYRELSGKGDETQQAAEAAANAAAWNSSLVDDLFRAQLQSTIICGGCGQRSHSFNSFLGDMALPLPARPGGVTLQVLRGWEQVEGRGVCVSVCVAAGWVCWLFGHCMAARAGRSGCVQQLDRAECEA